MGIPIQQAQWIEVQLDSEGRGVIQGVKIQLAEYPNTKLQILKTTADKIVEFAKSLEKKLEDESASDRETD